MINPNVLILNSAWKLFEKRVCNYDVLHPNKKGSHPYFHQNAKKTCTVVGYTE